MRRALLSVCLAIFLATVAAGPAYASHKPSRAERAAIITAIRQGIEQRFHRAAPAVGTVRVSSRGPWALARLRGPLFRVPASLALVARIHGTWTLVAESVSGVGCDEGESRAVDQDLGISRSWRLPDDACSAPTTRTQRCGGLSTAGSPFTHFSATHITCVDAVDDAFGWMANIQYGPCKTATRCGVTNRSGLFLTFQCRLKRLKPRRHHGYAALVTCATPLQRFRFILHRRP